MRRFLLTKPLTVLLSLLCAATLSPVFVVAAHAEFGFQSDLTPINGAQGTGHVDVSPTAEDDQNNTVFIAQGTAEIHGALRSTPYVVQRAANFNPATGVCEVDLSGPWADLTTPPTTFMTSPGGAGAEQFERMSAAPPGPQFDIIFRVVKQSDETAPHPPELISACMTVTVK